MELATNVLLTEAAVAQAHLAMLGDLVDRTRCDRLDTGRNLDEVTHLLADLVARTAGSG